MDPQYINVNDGIWFSLCVIRADIPTSHHGARWGVGAGHDPGGGHSDCVFLIGSEGVPNDHLPVLKHKPPRLHLINDTVCQVRMISVRGWTRNYFKYENKWYMHFKLIYEPVAAKESPRGVHGFLQEYLSLPRHKFWINKIFCHNLFSCTNKASQTLA